MKGIIEFFDSNWQGITSISAFLISIATFAILVRNSSRQRRHYINSIRPILVFDPIHIDGDFCFFIRNYGLGPALLQGFKAVSNKESKTFNQRDFIEYIKFRIGAPENERSILFSPDTAFPVGKDLCLFHFDAYDINPGRKKAALGILKDFTFTIEYTNLYNEIQTPCIFDTQEFDEIGIEKLTD